MRDFNETQNRFLVGPESIQTLGRLWTRYRSLYLGQGLEPNLQTLTYQQLRLVSLGVSPAAAELQSAITPTYLSDPRILNATEMALMDGSGRSLGKLFVDDIGSRILVEAEVSVPGAHEWCRNAIALLRDVVPHQAQLFSQMISWIIPIYHENHGRPFRRGFSHIEHLGGLFTTFAERASQPAELRRTVLAADFSHEMGHQALMLYQLSDEVLLDHATPVYSSVRKVNRPAIMALHACVASAYMMEVFEGVCQSSETGSIEKEFSRNSLLELSFHQRIGIESLKEAASFTQLGLLLVDELEAQVDSIVNHSRAEASEQSTLSYFGLLAP